jgi:hypothetical protein
MSDIEHIAGEVDLLLDDGLRAIERYEYGRAISLILLARSKLSPLLQQFPPQTPGESQP